MTDNTALSAEEVEVVRDNYGVPHVYSDSLRGLFYGQGYAIAEDRIFQLEMLRYMAQGRLAEVLGEDFLELDQTIRREGFTTDELEKSFDRGDEWTRTVVQGYADGVTAFVLELDDEALAEHDQFGILGIRPMPWTPADVLGLVVAQLGLRWFTYNCQIENSAILEDLVAAFGPADGCAIMDDLTPPHEDPEGVTAVPRDLWSEPSPFPSPKPATADRVIPGVGKLAGDLFGAMLRNGALLQRVGLLPKAGSQYWGAGKNRTPDGGSVMLDGPQMGWYSPGHLHETGLHGAGFNSVGASPSGLPGTMFGHNGSAAWGGTAGLGPMVCVYGVRLNEARDAYWHDEQWKPLEPREETYLVRDAEPVVETLHRTVHGEVIALSETDGLALTRSLTWKGLEMQTVRGILRTSMAETFDDFVDGCRDMLMSINWYYTDRDGNIGYSHTGLAGKWPERGDMRFVSDGSGPSDLLGTVPMESVPYVLNPPAGYMASWNPQSAPGWNVPQLTTIWGRYDHTRIMNDWFDQRPVIGEAEIKEFNRYVSALHEGGYFLRDRLVAALDANLDVLDDLGKTALELLREWDGNRAGPDFVEGNPQPGLLVFEAWLRQLTHDYLSAESIGTFGSLVFGYEPPLFQPAEDDADAQLAHAALTRLSGVMFWIYNVPMGARIVLNALDGDPAIAPRRDYFRGLGPERAVAESFARAVEYVAGVLGEDTSTWTMPTVYGVFSNRNFRGVPSMGPEPATAYMNRGATNHIVSLSPSQVKGVNIVAPGTREQRTVDGVLTRNAYDQFRLWKDFEYKPMNLTREDVNRATVSTRKLRVPQG